MGRRGARIATTVVLALAGLTLPVSNAHAIDPIAAEADLIATAFDGDDTDADPPFVGEPFTDTFNEELDAEAGPVATGSGRGLATQNTSLVRNGDALTSMTSVSEISASHTDQGRATAQSRVQVEFEVAQTKVRTIKAVLDASTPSDCPNVADVTFTLNELNGRGLLADALASCDGPTADGVEKDIKFRTGFRYLLIIEALAGSDDDTQDTSGAASWDFRMFPGLASEVPIECGDTILRSIALTEDLVCTETALFVGAPNITINLNGHRIEGDLGDDDPGIDNDAGFNDVTIKNGNIARFGDGIASIGGDGLTVANLIVEENAGNGVFTADVAVGTFRNIRALSNEDDGLDLECEGCLIENNRAEDNAQDGIRVIGGDVNTIRGNFTLFNDDEGLVLEDSNLNKLTNNRSNDNVGIGFFVTNSDENRFRENIAQRNERDGFQIRGDRNRFRENNAGLNGRSGIFLVLGGEHVLVENRMNSNEEVGLEMFGSQQNQVTSNIANANKRGGIKVYDDANDNTLTGNTSSLNEAGVPGAGHGIAIGASTGNTLAGNLSAANLADGINVADNADFTTLRGNTVKQSLDDGIEVDLSSDLAVLNNNRAKLSGDNGILVSSASATGRRNKASNSGSADCITPPSVGCTAV